MTRTWIIAEDALQHVDTLWFGFDSLATRGTDPQLCEWAYPEIPPVPTSFFFPVFFAEWLYEWGMGVDYRPFHPEPGVDTFQISFNYNLDSTYYPIHVRWSPEEIGRLCDSAQIADNLGLLFRASMTATAEASLPSRLFSGVTFVVSGARYGVLTGADPPLDRPTGYGLSQNYPNPFNPSTRISFTLGARSHVSLTIHDLLGREVASLVAEELPAGTYWREWHAAGVSSGVYLYRLQAGLHVVTRKLLLIR